MIESYQKKELLCLCASLALCALFLVGCNVKPKSYSTEEELVEFLKSNNPEIRSEAISILLKKKRYKNLHILMPALIKALKDRDGNIQINAMKILEKIGKKAKKAIPALNDMLTKKNYIHVERAIKALIYIGADETSFPLLMGCLEHEIPTIRESALVPLSRFRHKAKILVPSLVALLDDPFNGVRFNTIAVLGIMGDEAKIAIPKIKILSQQDEYQFVRTEAKRFLEKFEKQEK